jgi:6-phosphogluconolactonase (cycloisomerase 2 family)
MNTRIVAPEDASPRFDQGKPAQERAPSASHQKCRTPAAPVQEQNQTWSQCIRNRTWVMRASAALAIAVGLFASPLRAQFAYVANFNSNNVSGYTIDPSTGALTAIAGSPFAAGSFPRWVAVDPSGKFAYVVNEGDKNVSGYTIDPSTGALTAIAGSPFTTGGDPRSMAVDPSGKFAYVADFTGNVLGYTINPSTGALTAIAGSPFTGGQAGLNSVAVDPSGRFAYVVNEDVNNVLGYTINPSTGALTAIAGSPFAAGIGAISVAVDPSGMFAYVANAQVIGQNGNVSAYTIDSSTGALTAIAGSPFAAGQGPQSVAVDPSGKFAYVANFGGGVSGYTIGPTTGALTPIAGSPFGAGNGPNIGAVDPSGKFAYVTNFSGNNVSGYTIDPSTGALTAVAGSPFAAGGGPFSVAIITPPPLVPFASSSAKLEITAGPPSSFDLNESFTLGKNSTGINPVTQNVTLTIGSFSVTVPTGSFTKIPNGRFAFQGTISGVSLQVQIVPLGNNIFTFKAEGAGANLTGLTNPVTVVLTIGNNSGSTTTTAQFH